VSTGPYLLGLGWSPAALYDTLMIITGATGHVTLSVPEDEDG
jgi:hypothetical protein